MSDTKSMPKVVEVVPVMTEVEIEVPTQNDSTEGLANLYRGLEPAAMRLRSAAFSLLLISFLFCGTLEGLFGMAAAVSVLCCAAPGSLGTAYAARCTRIAAIICAALALGQLLVLSTFSFVVPHMPDAVANMCQEMPPAAVPAPTTADQTFDAPAKTADMGAYEIDISAIQISSLEVPSTPQEGAQSVVFVAAVAARRLQALAPATAAATPDDVKCARAQQFVTDVLPWVVMMGMIGELCLFIIAMSTARRALELMHLARRCGANAL